jgi:glycosyltransferase involved in cell wall biosynthesis
MTPPDPQAPMLPSPSPQDATPAPVLSVIVPNYDEIATLPEILERVEAVPIDKEIIVVDDGSTDGSREWALARAASGAKRLRVLLHERNQGKTAALRTGIAAARGRFILIQDADLEYDPADYPQLLQPLLDGKADVVYGSRFIGAPRRVLLFWHHVGNSVLTLLSNAVTGLDLTDMETCYKVFRTDALKRLPIRSSGFGFEAEITVKVAQLGLRVYEVPISYAGREYWEGKKITWRDGVQAVHLLLRFALWPDLDEEALGFLALQRTEKLQRYHRYLWDKMRPWVGRRILELGARTGTITQYLVNREHVTATEDREGYLDYLTRRFAGRGNVEIRELALGGADPVAPKQRYDTVLCTNVLEHVEDDAAALRWIHDRLEPGGRVVLVVPLLRALYGSIDAASEKHRRYETAELRAKLEAAGFEIEELRPFNAIGVFVRWLESRVLRRREVPGFQTRIADRLVPWLRLEEKLGLSFGMTAFAVGRRPA